MFLFTIKGKRFFTKKKVQ